MTSTELSALGFSLLAGLAIAFQLALAAGAPWGALALGGRYPGRLPPPMRVAAVVQAALLAALAGLVLARAGLALPGWAGLARRAIWGVVAFAALASLLNLITPSRRERALWAPVALGMLGTSVGVALA